MISCGCHVESTQRIEAFSDGVFAIAITLLVLEFKVPHESAGDAAALARALWKLWPSYFAYFLSFLIIGIYWVNHHYIFRIYKRSDHIFALLNVLFLMCISFLPFPTAVLAQHVNDPASCKPATVFYAVGLLLPAVTWLLIWIYASSGHRLIDGNLTRGFIRVLTLQYALSVVLYLIALATSVVAPVWGLTICVSLTLLYLLPSRKPEHHSV